MAEKKTYTNKEIKSILKRARNFHKKAEVLEEVVREHLLDKIEPLIKKKDFHGCKLILINEFSGESLSKFDLGSYIIDKEEEHKEKLKKSKKLKKAKKK